MAVDLVELLLLGTLLVDLPLFEAPLAVLVVVEVAF